MANNADKKDAWVFIKREMDNVYNMVDAAPFVNLPDISLDNIRSRFFGFKMIAERLAPSKLPVINKLERIILDCQKGKISEKNAFFQIKPIAERFNLDPGLIARVERRINIPAGRSKHYAWKPHEWKPMPYKMSQIPQARNPLRKNDKNSFKVDVKPFKMPKCLSFENFKPMRKNQNKRLAPQFKNVSDMFGGRR